MSSVIERAQREAVKRMLNGQHSRTFYDGAHFAATITPEQIETAALLLFEQDAPAHHPDEWLTLAEGVREAYRVLARATFRAAGFTIEGES